MKLGQIYTRDEVVEMVGAGDDYILNKYPTPEGPVLVTP